MAGLDREHTGTLTQFMGDVTRLLARITFVSLSFEVNTPGQSRATPTSTPSRRGLGCRYNCTAAVEVPDGCGPKIDTWGSVPP